MICDIQAKQSVIQANRRVIRLILCVCRTGINGFMSMTSRRRKELTNPQKCFSDAQKLIHKPQQDSHNPRHATVNVEAQDSFLDLRMYLERFTLTVIWRPSWTPLVPPFEHLRAWKLRLAQNLTRLMTPCVISWRAFCRCLVKFIRSYQAVW